MPPHVAIIGTDIQDHLFPGVDPLGQELRVDGTPYTVIGVSEKQGSTFGQSQDNWVGVPLTAYQKNYGTQKSLTIYVKAGSAGPVLDDAADEVRVLMRSQRHDRPGRAGLLRAGHQQHAGRLLQHDHELLRRGRRRHCADLAGGRRHRDHEHHAGERHRADARDRDTQGAGRAAEGHPDAVPDRVGNDGAGRRSLRRDRRHHCGAGGYGRGWISLDRRVLERACGPVHGDHRRASSSACIRRARRRGWTRLWLCGRIRQIRDQGSGRQRLYADWRCQRDGRDGAGYAAHEQAAQRADDSGHRHRRDDGDHHLVGGEWAEQQGRGPGEVAGLECAVRLPLSGVRLSGPRPRC